MKKQFFLKGRVICFKHWCRKGWSAFASMHREVKIGVLATTMSILTLAPGSASAQSDSLAVAKTVEMEAVNVSATRLNPTRGAGVHTVAYLRDTVSAAPLQTIEATLRLAPAVDIRERGAKGVQADISLRGGSADQTMVLLNGINFTDARTGHQSHSLPVDMGAVSSIDILTDVVGVGAFAGAVNIITSPVFSDYIKVELAAGQFGEVYLNASGATTTADGMSVFGAASLRRTDGYASNTDFSNLNAYIRLTVPTGAVGLLDVQAGVQNRQFGANEFYSFAYPNQFEATQTALGSTRWSADIGRWSVAASASYRWNIDRFELFRAGKDAPAWYVQPNYHQTDNVGSTLQAGYDWGRAGRTSAGVDYTYNHIYSNVLGVPLAHPFKAQGSSDLYTKGTARSVGNFWAGHEFGRGRLRVVHILGVAATPYGAYPSISVVARQGLGEQWSVNLGVTRSMRLPTFTDLYYTTVTHEGNAALKPETAVTHRIGAQWRRRGWFASLGGYWRMGREVIDWVKDNAAENSRWESAPIPTLHTFGVEGEVGWYGGKVLRKAVVAGAWLDVHRTDELSANWVSRYALDYLRGKIVARLSVNIYKGIIADATVGWYDRCGTYVVGAEKSDYRPFWLADARLSWTRGWFAVFVDATNLLNSRYADFGGLTMPPRWFTLGVELRIEN